MSFAKERQYKTGFFYFVSYFTFNLTDNLKHVPPP